MAAESKAQLAQKAAGHTSNDDMSNSFYSFNDLMVNNVGHQCDAWPDLSRRSASRPYQQEEQQVAVTAVARGGIAL